MNVFIEKGEMFVEIRELINKEILLFDGGMGTMLQMAGLKLGEQPELLNFTNEEVIDVEYKDVDE